MKEPKFKVGQNVIWDSTASVIDESYEGKDSGDFVYKIHTFDSPKFFPLVYEDEITTED